MPILNSPELIAAFEAELQQLVGLKCWSIIAGRPSGSIANLQFGQKMLRDHPSTNPNLSVDERNFRGEVNLMTYACPWRIEAQEQIIGSWLDNNDIGGPMLAALDQLIGKRVERVELLRPGLDLTLVFSEGYVLRLFCDQTSEENRWGNYIYFTKKHSYTVGARSQLRVELRDNERN